jgi:chitodextrinase
MNLQIHITPKKLYIKTLMGVVAAFVAAPVALLAGSGTAAAACAAPATDYGKVTSSLSVPSTATYRIWSRIMVPNTTAKSYLLEVDGGNCYSVGGGTFTANTWTWVDYQSGTTTNKVQQSLTAGSHTLKLIGNADGVKVDRVIATSDTSCTPTGAGDNCNTPNDTQAPTVTLTAPAEGASVTGSVAVTATATDNTSVGRVEFYDNTTLIGTDTSSPYSVSWDTSKVTNGSHLITAKAYDAAGNMGSDSNTVTAKNGDTQSPSVPTGLTATAQSYNTIKLSWKASTDNTGVTGYTILRDGVPVATVGAVTAYTDASLSANTSYGYQVQASDAAGNKSASSTKVTAKTQNVADSQAPAKVTGLSAQVVSQNQVNLTWTASTDNIGVTGYDVYRATGDGDAKKVGTSATTSYGDTNLSADTSYAYYVVAKDASGNAAQPSDTITAKTQAEDTGSGGSGGGSTDPTHVRSRIVGTVTDQSTGKAVPFTIIKIMVNNHRHTYISDRHGRYAMYGLKANHYNVVYKAHGYYSQTISVNLAGSPITQNVSLKKR